MQKKKICFVVAQPGTARSFLKGPIELLSEHFDVYLAANFSNNDDVSDMKLAGWKHIPIERRPSIGADIKALKLLTKYFKEENFDATHSITKKASLLCCIAAKRAKVACRIHHFTGQMWSTMTGFRRWFYRYLDVMMVKRDNHFLVDGYSQQKYLEEHKVLKPGQSDVLGNGSICGANTVRFKTNNESRERIRKELNIADETCVYIFLGRLKREKGINELYDAYNTILPQCPKSLLLLVGTDEEHCAERFGEYENFKEGNNVLFYGRTPKPEDLLNAADVFVLPTYREGFGLSVLEASCVGIPVICSDTYGVMDAMQDDVTGLRCKTYDVETLANCMRKLYEDADLRKELGRNGTKYVQEKFSGEYMSQCWLQYYLENVK